MTDPIEISNPELATIAVHNLGGAVNPVDLEDLAIELFSLAPKRFCWKKYKERIDLRIVLYSVNDAIKTNIGFIKGNSKFGYMLTESGLQWIEDKSKNGTTGNSVRRLSNIDLAEREKIRLRKTNAYQKFIGGKSDLISQIDFIEFTRVNDYFPSQIKEQRFIRIQNIVNNDVSLQETWEILKQRFIQGRK